MGKINEIISIPCEMREFAITANGDNYGLFDLRLIFLDKDPRVVISNILKSEQKSINYTDVIIIDPRTMVIEGRIGEKVKPMFSKIMEFIEKNKDLLLYHSKNPDISMTEFFNSITKV